MSYDSNGAYIPTGQYGAPARTEGSYVRECIICGSAVPNSRLKRHDDFHKEFSNRKGSEMGVVGWCDPGDHAFKVTAPGSFHGTAQVIGDNGQPESQEIDACVNHNPFRMQPEHIVKELEADYPISPSAPINAVSPYPQDEIPRTW